MTDNNYEDVLSWFKQCFEAARHLPADSKDEYMLQIAENIRRTTDDFFQYTHLPVRKLSSLEKQISSSISQALKPAELFTKVAKKCELTTETPCEEPTCALFFAKLYNKLMWAAIVSGILLLLLFLLLVTLCWVRNCTTRALMGGSASCAYSRGMDGPCTCAASHEPSSEKKNPEAKKTNSAKSESK